MECMRHNVIVVTSCDEKSIIDAYFVAMDIFREVSSLTLPALNGCRSFFVPPDGSKEGQDDTNIGSNDRAQFISWLQSTRDQKGNTPLDWIEVEFGGDKAYVATTST